LFVAVYEHGGDIFYADADGVVYGMPSTIKSKNTLINNGFRRIEEDGELGRPSLHQDGTWGENREANPVYQKWITLLNEARPVQEAEAEEVLKEREWAKRAGKANLGQ